MTEPEPSIDEYPSDAASFLKGRQLRGEPRVLGPIVREAVYCQTEEADIVIDGPSTRFVRAIPHEDGCFEVIFDEA